jgi:hypothetical protein
MRARLSISPGTAIAVVALFLALGGSAFAVGERIQSTSVAQQRCTNGAVRGVAVVTGDPSKGMANLPDQFTSASGLFSRRFNCSGRAIQVRRAEIGVYEVRFLGNTAPSAIAGGIGLFSATAEPLGAGAFRIRVQNVWRAVDADARYGRRLADQRLVTKTRRSSRREQRGRSTTSTIATNRNVIRLFPTLPAASRGPVRIVQRVGRSRLRTAVPWRWRAACPDPAERVSAVRRPVPENAEA